MAAIANFAGVKPRVNAARAGRFAGSRVSKVRLLLRLARAKEFPSARDVAGRGG